MVYTVKNRSVRARFTAESEYMHDRDDDDGDDALLLLFFPIRCINSVFFISLCIYLMLSRTKYTHKHSRIVGR